MIAVALADLAERFDCFLVDQFGVLLSGDGAYPGAPTALAELARRGGRVLLLSNSGKRSERNMRRLDGYGFDRGSYETVLSSGEVAHAVLRDGLGKTWPRRARVLVLARGGDTSAIDGLDLCPTDQAAEADLILLAGSEGDRLSLGDYATRLRPAAERKVPCLCTNPDQLMLTPTGQHFGAGRVARLYEELGGPVEWIGKPHPAIYTAALDLLGQPDPARVICIGDSPEHDVAGGRGAGLATALVRTGIHADISDEELAALCARKGAVPDFVIPAFQF